uniref:DCL protein n=1 Tax=Kalanchoe fedtschenkoi TaxID=63787 RepID=A0A7N0VJS2_KALFE
MASIFRASTQLVHFYRESSSLSLSSTFFHFPCSLDYRVRSLRTAPDGARVGSQDVYGQDLLRKPVVTNLGVDGEDESEDEDEEEAKVGNSDGGGGGSEKWVDWEDQILEETAPLVGFVRMILHSNKYKSGDRLSPENEKTILERLLPYHPEYEKKIGCGIDYLTVGYHPDFETSRCLFIVRKNGEVVDFSYWKCIKGLIRKNYPLYADTFILRHFRWHRRKE